MTAPACPPGAATVPMALVVSFGFLHDGPPVHGGPQDPGGAGGREELPRADVVADLRELTADDSRATAAVLTTPSIPALISGLCLTAAVGCVGGRHRSAAVIVRVGRQLKADGVPAAVVPRDIAKPVARRATGAAVVTAPAREGRQAAP